MNFPKPNEYTETWLNLFLFSINAQQTEREVAFLRRVLPLPKYGRVLDVCCGSGRHSHSLAQNGYRTVGIDTNGLALSTARKNAVPGEQYILHDMRQLVQLRQDVDAVICLWQSFGYFDSLTNRAVLNDIADFLQPKGRCVFDLYHPEFFYLRQGTRKFSIGDREITEEKVCSDGRLNVTLYEDSTHLVGSFDWELFSPEQLIEIAQNVGLKCLNCCTDYDEAKEPRGESARIQYVFEKTNPSGYSLAV